MEGQMQKGREIILEIPSTTCSPVKRSPSTNSPVDSPIITNPRRRRFDRCLAFEVTPPAGIVPDLVSVPAPAPSPPTSASVSALVSASVSVAGAGIGSGAAGSIGRARRGPRQDDNARRVVEVGAWAARKAVRGDQGRRR
jgi:hypothetical protein